MTESIHAKIISELQNHPESFRKPQTVENHDFRNKRERRDPSSGNRVHAEGHPVEKGIPPRGGTPAIKEHQTYNSEYSSKPKDYSSVPKKESVPHARDSMELYHMNASKRSSHKRDDGHLDPYRRSESGERQSKGRSSHASRGPMDNSEEERIYHKDFASYEKAYQEYLKELATQSKRNSRSSASGHQSTTEKSSRMTKSRSREKTAYQDNPPAENYAASQNQDSDTISTLNMALEKMLEKDQEKSSRRKDKRKPALQYAQREGSEKVPEPETEQPHSQTRSRSSGHNRKKSNTMMLNNYLQIVTPSQSSKAAPSSRVDQPEASQRRNYERGYEGEPIAPSSTTTRKSSRRHFTGLNEMENYNSAGMNHPHTASNKSRADVPRSSSNKPVTPTGSYNSGARDMRNLNEAALLNKSGRDLRAGRKQDHHIQNEHTPKIAGNRPSGASGPGLVLANKSGFSMNKEAKYPFETMINQMEPISELPPAGDHADERKRQYSTHDYVNYETLCQEREATHGGVNKSGNGSFLMFNLNNSNLESVNSSTLFEAFPVRKSQKENGGKAQGMPHSRFANFGLN